MKSLVSGGDTTVRHAEHIELARLYNLRLDATGMGYPSSPSRPDRVCMKLVEAEAGIGYAVLAKNSSMIRRTILEAAAERGVEPRVRPRLNWGHTVAELRAICLARAEYERPADLAILADVNAFFAILGKKLGLAFSATTALSEHASAEEAIAPEIPQFAAHCLAEAREGLGAPGTFELRLRFECALRGISPGFLAHVLSLKPALVTRWTSGQRRPTSKHKADIARLEDYLGLEQDTLWKLISRRRVRAGHISSNDLPPERCATRYQKDILKRTLPRDFSSRSEDEKPGLLNEAFAEIDRRAKSPRGKISKQRRDHYVLKDKDFSARLAEEFDELRENRLPKILPFNDWDQQIGLNEESFEKWKQRLCGYLGFLHRRLHELVNVPGYRPEDLEADAPGVSFVCVPREDLTLAFAIVPDLIRAYQRWLNWRKGSFDRTQKPTKDDIEFVKELERLTRVRRKRSFDDKLRARPNSVRTTI
ncbi:hypothetical protein V1281_000373 [Nitrobacteraceae bacterium AZCC 2161]